MESIILAIETATPACSAALLIGNRVFERFEIAPKAHADVILPMITALLNEAAIDLRAIKAIAVGQGPGSFTGLRIAMSVAQGLAYGLQLPVYPISTLAALAYQAFVQLQFPSQTVVMPLLDARMQEVYAAAYGWHNNELITLQREHLCSPQALNLDFGQQRVLAIGSGWETLIQKPHCEFLADCFPQAKDIALLAQQQIAAGNKGMDAQQVLPLYVRDKVAEPSR